MLCNSRNIGIPKMRLHGNNYTLHFRSFWDSHETWYFTRCESASVSTHISSFVFWHFRTTRALPLQPSTFFFLLSLSLSKRSNMAIWLRNVIFMWFGYCPLILYSTSIYECVHISRWISCLYMNGNIRFLFPTQQNYYLASSANL